MKNSLDFVNEYLKNGLDQLCNELLPSDVVEDIKNAELVFLAKTERDYGRFMDQFKISYDLIVKLSRYLNYVERGWPKHRSAQFLLLIHNLKSLYSAFDRLTKGFYEDSFILIRPPYESILKIVFITCYPGRPYFPIVGKDENKTTFNFTSFMNDQLKLKWSEYDIYSWASHANKYSVMTDAKALYLGEKKDDISLKFKYNEKLLQVGINSIQFVSWFYLKLILKLFVTKDYNSHAKDLRAKAERLCFLRESALLLSPSKSIPKAVKDSNNLFEMIDRVERGENWKDAWKEIRGR